MIHNIVLIIIIISIKGSNVLEVKEKQVIMFLLFIYLVILKHGLEQEEEE